MPSPNRPKPGDTKTQVPGIITLSRSLWRYWNDRNAALGYFLRPDRYRTRHDFCGDTPFAWSAAEDRVLALDTLYVNSMIMVLTLGIEFGSRFFFDIALLIALFGFVGSAAMAKFLLRGEVIEP